MKCNIFIRSYNKDCQWLKYCIKSIEKYAKGFNDVILTYPKNHDCCYNKFVKNFPIKEICPNGYIDQQLTKLSAYKYCDDDVTHILYVDSDACFTDNVYPDFFMEDDKPIVYMTPYSSFIHRDELCALKWKNVTEKFVKVNVEFEFMRRSPFLYKKSSIISLQNWFLNNHGISIDQYIVNNPSSDLSEYNLLGAYIYYHGNRDEYQFINTVDNEVRPQPFFLQNYSWDGLNESIEQKLIEITS